MPSRAKKRYFDPPASGRGQGCPMHALAPPEGGLTPAAAAPAASPQTPAPASTAVGHSQAPGGGERHAPSHARDTARCPCIADIPRSLDAPSPDPGNGSRRAPIRDPHAPASRSVSRARAPQGLVPSHTSRRYANPPSSTALPGSNGEIFGAKGLLVRADGAAVSP